MQNIILFIKSYKPDYERVLVLLNSIKKFNRDNIPVYLSVNDADYDFFNAKIDATIFLLKDSDIISCNIKDPWRYQQVIKSSVHKLNICKNYLCLDSDSEFITDFHIKDFIYKEDVPYTIIHDPKCFLETMERINIDTEKIFFKEAINCTRDFLNINDTERVWDFGPSPLLWSTKVWKAIEDYLAKDNLTLENYIMDVYPSESIIYGEFLRTNKTIEIIPVGPYFKVYHYKKQYKMEKKYHKIDTLKKIYLGVIFQSNWKKKSKYIFW